MAGSEQQLLLGQIETVTVNSPYVKALLEEVKVVLTEAVAGSSSRGYSGHWRRWLAFAEEHPWSPSRRSPMSSAGTLYTSVLSLNL